MAKALLGSLAQHDEETLYRMLSVLPEAALVADDDGRYVYANAAACRLTGRTMAQLRKLTVAELAAPHQPFEPVWDAFTADGTLHGDFELGVPDGTVVTVEFNARTNVLPGRHVSFLRDVTAKRHLEARLRRDVDRFVSAFVQAPVAMTIQVLRTGVIVEANNEFHVLSGRTRTEVLGRAADEPSWWEDSQPAADVIAQLRHGIVTGRAAAMLLTRRRESVKVALCARRIEATGELHAVTTYVPL